ncbi:hypothetical protein MCEGE14_00054 [Burkholderiaceae bacterium]
MGSVNASWFLVPRLFVLELFVMTLVLRDVEVVGCCSIEAMGAEIASADVEVDVDVDVSADIVWFEFCEEVGVGSCTSMRNDSSSITVSLFDPFLEGYPPIEIMIAM